MKYFVAVLFFIAASALALPTMKDVETEWSQFKIQYRKVYKNLLEEKQRKNIFAANYKLVKEHNEQYELGLETYTLRLNHFADTTAEERKYLKGYKKINKNHNFEKFKSNPVADLPTSVDWRNKGAVTKVKDQGDCGSCWAFSTTGSLEGQYFLKSGKLVEISEQNLVDCSTENDACEGGDMPVAFEYILKNGGIDSEQSYPYKGRKGKCNYNPANNVTSIKGHVILKEGSESQLQEASATIGPISVAIDASSEQFDFYGSGIYNPKNCKTANNELDHAVLVVGYGTENGKDFWWVKNSWSTSWGIKGYIKMIRNENNHCGIATEACYPVMK